MWRREKKSKSKNGYKLSCCERVSNDAIEEARGRLNEYWNVIKETDLWKMTQNICYEFRIEIKTYILQLYLHKINDLRLDVGREWLISRLVAICLDHAPPTRAGARQSVGIQLHKPPTVGDGDNLHQEWQPTLSSSSQHTFTADWDWWVDTAAACVGEPG